MVHRSEFPYLCLWLFPWVPTAFRFHDAVPALRFAMLLPNIWCNISIPFILVVLSACVLNNPWTSENFLNSRKTHYPRKIFPAWPKNPETHENFLQVLYSSLNFGKFTQNSREIPSFCKLLSIPRKISKPRRPFSSWVGFHLSEVSFSLKLILQKKSLYY